MKLSLYLLSLPLLLAFGLYYLAYGAPNLHLVNTDHLVGILLLLSYPCSVVWLALFIIYLCDHSSHRLRDGLKFSTIFLAAALPMALVITLDLMCFWGCFVD
jgi:hypothetical protein